MQTRTEKDLLGEMEVPAHAYYGIQTCRAIDNFNISSARFKDYRSFIWGLGAVKMAAAKANHELGLLSDSLSESIIKACEEVMEGKFDDQFPIDMIQGGAGTSTNMNANEVIANRALELMGHKKGEYEHCSPNDHVNMSQSTNDAYPTSSQLSLIRLHTEFIEHLKLLIVAFRAKGEEFSDVIKMGRTQLQDAVPMTLGQEFNAFANNLAKEVDHLAYSANFFNEVNMGATAIGTGLNAAPGYAQACVKHLCRITGYPIVLAKDLVEATPDTGAYVAYSSALKSLAIKLSRICNDLRILSSGPRTGFNEINLPPMQPGSSIMPGKVNPVIPEVVNQVCFKVIGNNLTVSLAAEAGQLQLNVMEPIMAQSILESIDFLKNALKTLTDKCVNGITANEAVCKETVLNSIGIITALNPYIGYKNSNKIAREALESGRGIDELVIEHKLLTEEQLSRILDPETMLSSGKRIKI